MTEPLRRFESLIENEALATVAVHQTILSLWPCRFALEQLSDDQPVGAAGLGLDSLEVVELIMVCEQACGTSASEELFAVAPLTIGHLIADLRRPG